MSVVFKSLLSASLLFQHEPRGCLQLRAAGVWPAPPFRELHPRHPSSPSPSLSYLLVEKHKGSLCSEEGRRCAVTRTGTWCQRIWPLETTFGVFGRRWCFGNNRIKRGQKEQNMWPSHGTTSVKTTNVSVLDQRLDILRIFYLNGCCLTSAGNLSVLDLSLCPHYPSAHIVLDWILRLGFLYTTVKTENQWMGAFVQRPPFINLKPFCF